MLHINNNYYVKDGELYIIKKLKPSKYGYRITNPDGTRKWVSVQRVQEIEEVLKCKKSQSTK